MGCANCKPKLQPSLLFLVLNFHFSFNSSSPFLQSQHPWLQAFWNTNLNSKRKKIKEASDESWERSHLIPSIGALGSIVELVRIPQPQQGNPLDQALDSRLQKLLPPDFFFFLKDSPVLQSSHYVWVRKRVRALRSFIRSLILPIFLL